MENDATQPSTQQVLDPRRLGRNNSGLNSHDVSNVMCILHPTTLAAFRVVRATAERKPEHVLQNGTFSTFNQHVEVENIEEADTFILDPNQRDQANEINQAHDLALRFDSKTVSPLLGFCFGRNEHVSDIVFSMDTAKRISNLHFRIFANPAGVIMVGDLSTNGTLVDGVHLKGKVKGLPATRMLNQGSTISILSTRNDESISFIVRFPARDDFEDAYTRNFQAYMARVALAEQQQLAQQGRLMPAFGRGLPASDQHGALAKPSIMAQFNTFGMHWNGGDQYNVIGQLGKGAFATVYKLATAMDGKVLAAKELDKKRFIKNGQLDHRLDNEMQIMKGLRHPNIVQYIDYHDVHNHLYIIMEYVPCGDLQAHLARRGPLKESDAKLMSRQILRSLAYLHQKDITHRDIKPDNILIASEDPFIVKLSDFGLSKVVKNNDTFLKTFCGTLLYCAPEVFPHYNGQEEKKGVKRPRHGRSQKTFHSYSQSVDIWSFAAVLWYALCSSPPFEGVIDASGRGMFDKIMGTALNTTPLKARGISSEAIDLLLKMLNTDPAQRPTERQCLTHPWLRDDSDPEEDMEKGDLNAIPEEDEVDEIIDDDAEVGAERKLSQLSINPEGSGVGFDSYDDEVEFSSQELELLDPRQSKRVRQDVLIPRNQMRDAGVIESSPEISMDSVPEFHNSIGESFVIPQTTPKRRLFGEISESALQNSGILDAHMNAALAIPQRNSNGESNSDTSLVENRNVPNSSRRRATDSRGSFGLVGSKSGSQVGLLAAASLLGAESMVRELNMESPESATSPTGTTNDPSTPKSPESPHTPAQEEQCSHPEEETPKARQTSFNRQFHLSIPQHMLVEPGTMQDYDAHGADSFSLPATEASSLTANDSHLTPSINRPIVTAEDDFRRPPPRLGKLVSTEDSFQPIVLKLDQRTTTWGRDPHNTIQYLDLKDTRIPKCCLSIWFYAPGIEKAEERSQDWTKMEGLHTYVKAHSRIGLLINGVKLHDKNKEKKDEFGRLHSGDVITVFQDDKETLKFVCEFNHGSGRELRPIGSNFEILDK